MGSHAEQKVVEWSSKILWESLILASSKKLIHDWLLNERAFSMSFPPCCRMCRLYIELSQHCWVISQIRISIISRSRRLLPIKTEVHDGLHACLWTENCIIGSSTTLQTANVNFYSNAFEYDKLSDLQNSLQYFFNWKDRKRQKVVSCISD